MKLVQRAASEPDPAASSSENKLPSEINATRAARNTAALLSTRILIAAFGWVGSVLIARTLSPDAFGAFSLVFGVLGLMAVVTDLGVGRVVLADLVKANPTRPSDLAGSFIVLRLTLGLVGYVVAVGFVMIAGYSREIVIATAVGGLVVVIATPSHALSVIYQSRLQMSYVAVVETIAQFMQLLLTVCAVLWAPYLLILMLPPVANELVSAVLKIGGMARGRTGAAPGWHGILRFWKPMLIEAIPLSIGYALIQMTAKVDILLLSKMDTLNSVGLYSVGYKFSDFVLVAGLAVSTPFMTLLVSAWPDDSNAFVAATRRSMGIIAGLGALGIAVFWPCATPLLGLLYGSRFEAAGLATNLLVTGAVMAGLSQIGMLALVSAGKHRSYPWLALIALGLNVGLNFVFIPWLSYTGAAYVTLITEVAIAGGIALILRRSIPFPGLIPWGKISIFAALSLIFVLASTGFQQQFNVPWIVCGSVTAILFMGAAHILGLTEDFGIHRRKGATPS